MIQLYTWGTPNGKKVSIMLEEVGLSYEVHPINLQKGDQFTPEYLAINPNNKIPSIIDPDGPGGQPLTLFESGAILMYLAEKTGKLWPQDMRKRYEVMQWLMFQMGGIGPMLGQAHHFRIYAPDGNTYAIDRYTNEAARLYGVLDAALADREFIAGDYSIADMATIPWIMPYRRQGQDLADYPNLRRWFDALRARPAVSRGLDVGKSLHKKDITDIDEDMRQALFGTNPGKIAD